MRVSRTNNLAILPVDSQRRSGTAKKSKLPASRQDYHYNDDDDDDYYSRPRLRGDPEGRSYSPADYNETDRYGRVPPTRLPPVQVSGSKRKKKKKGTVTYSDEVGF